MGIYTYICIYVFIFSSHTPSTPDGGVGARPSRQQPRRRRKRVKRRCRGGSASLGGRVAVGLRASTSTQPDP